MNKLTVDEAYSEYSLSDLENKIGIKFKNKINLVTALTRSSFINENNVSWNDNELLEFLGDSVLELIISEQLYNEHQTSPGDLTNRRKKLVNSKFLAEKLELLDINNHLLLGRGEKENINSFGSNFSENIFEALIGAIYLEENGLMKTKKFIKNVTK